MMSRNLQLPQTILALSLLVPWCAADDAAAQGSRSDSVRRATTGGRVATRPMRASGARTRSDSLGVRSAVPSPRSAPAADDAVIISPMTPVQESAALLMRLPPGKRIVHIAGFAGDIAAYGDARAAGTSGAVQFSADSDSGLQRGIERVRDRVLHRMKALRVAGGRIDAFTVEHPAALPAGPFGEMMLAEAVDSAVLEVFPRAEAPLRGDAELAADDAPDEEAEAVAAGEDAPGGPPTGRADAPPQHGARAVASANAGGAHAEVPHWESAMQERGIAWERIMEDARQGAHASSGRAMR